MASGDFFEFLVSKSGYYVNKQTERANAFLLRLFLKIKLVSVVRQEDIIILTYYKKRYIISSTALLRLLTIREIWRREE